MEKNAYNADRSELLATYDNYGKEMVKVSKEEFHTNFNVKTYNSYTMGCSDVTRYSIDGYDYFCYSTVYNVGWQGDVDCDEFICKVKTSTAKEIEEFCNIFS